MRGSIAALATSIALWAMLAFGAAAPSAARLASLRFGGAHHRLIALGGTSRRRFAARHRHAGRGRHIRRRGGGPAEPILGGVPGRPGYGALRPSSIGPAPSLPMPPAYTPPTMMPTPQYYTVPGLMDYCASRYRSYDPATNTRQDANGVRRSCP
jgi:BA14K-like protein